MAPIPDRSLAEEIQLEIAVEEIAAILGDAKIILVDVAVAKDTEGISGLPAVTEQVEPGLHRILTVLYVATREILEHHHADLDTIRPQTEVLTVEKGEWFEHPRR